MELRALADGLWVVDHVQHGSGLRIRLRSTVARLPDGRLWIHSHVHVVRRAILR